MEGIYIKLRSSEEEEVGYVLDQLYGNMMSVRPQENIIKVN